MQQLITWFLNDVMREEVTQQVELPRYTTSKYEEIAPERTPATISEDLVWGDHIPEITITRGHVKTKVFKRYSRTEKALENAFIELYLKGISTRKVENVISLLGARSDLSLLCLKSISVTRCEGIGVYGKDHRFPHSIFLYRLIPGDFWVQELQMQQMNFPRKRSSLITWNEVSIL